VRIDLIATLLGAGLLGFQGPLGTVRQVAIESNDSGTVAFRVTGANPCGAVHFVYGDGNAVTHPIVDLPTTITHRYSKTGDYTVTVSGMGNCQGETQTRVRATVPVRGPQPQAEAEAQTTGRGRGAASGRARGRGNPAEIRFAGMDRDADRVITRDEWTGSVASFRIHDWNRDGVLSGAEIQMGATRPEDAAVGSASDRNGVPTWSRAVFQRLDTNDDGRVALGEWRYEAEAFRRADRNGDRFITAEEFLATDVDDDRDDRFEYLDMNNDGFLSGTEWHGSAATFDWLDQNRDRRLSRLEAVGEGAIQRGGGAAGPTTRLQIRGDTPWMDTGLTVRLGEELIVRATGEVQLSARADDRADAEGSRLGRVNARAPLPRELAGALIARVDRSEPFVVSQPGNIIRVGQAGRLYLGINDENFADNRGQLEVTITRTNGQQ
jgi:hypothetical protein